MLGVSMIKIKSIEQVSIICDSIIYILSGNFRIRYVRMYIIFFQNI